MRYGRLALILSACTLLTACGTAPDHNPGEPATPSAWPSESSTPTLATSVPPLLPTVERHVIP